MKNFFIFLGFLLVLAGGYYLGQKYNFKLEPKTTQENVAVVFATPKASLTPADQSDKPLVGADTDEHGCKGSAGYSWCETKQKCLRIWEEPCDDSEEIKQALVKKHGWNIDEIVVSVSKNVGNYASGTVREKSSEVGGGMFFAAKVGDEWKIVFDGNGTVACESLESYPDFPNTMIPECFDEATGAMRKR